MDIPDPFTDLVKLNAFIGVRFVKTQNDKSKVVPGGFQRFRETDRLERIRSSGNKLDCLIHSFLTATCPNFRRLDEGDKDFFADIYRRRIFTNIARTTHAYKRQVENEKKQGINENERRSTMYRISSIDFLENIEITILCEYYHIKMLVFEVLVGVPSVVLYGLNGQRNTDNDTVYMIYNPGQGHFEAVRIKGTNNYSIPFVHAETLRLLHPLPDVVPAVAAPPAPVVPPKRWLSWRSPASVAAPQPAPQPVARPMARPVAIAEPIINMEEYNAAAGPWGSNNSAFNAWKIEDPPMNNDVKEEWNKFLLRNIGIYRLTDEEINNIFDTFSRGKSIDGIEIGKILLAMNLGKDVIRKIVRQARGNSPGRQYPEKRELNREEFKYAIQLAENVLKLPKLSIKDWICPVCNTLNVASAKDCGVCSTPKPSSGGRRKTRGKKRGTRRQVTRR
jgi:hypothetical protein